MACAHHGPDSLCGTDCPGYLHPGRVRQRSTRPEVQQRPPRPEVIDPPAPVVDESGAAYPEHANGETSERIGE